MPTFFYVAKSSPEKIVQGNLEAESKKLALEKLFQMGYSPIRLEDENRVSHKKSFFFRKKILRDFLQQFTREIADLLEAKIPLTEALELVFVQFPTGFFREEIGSLKELVKGGSTFSEALAQHPKIFSRFYVSMVRAGESAGVLDQIVSRLSAFLESEDELRSKIVAMLIYPCFVLGLGIVTSLFLVFFVVPRLSQMFLEVGQSLPPLTLYLMHFSRFGLKFSWFFLLLIFFAVWRFKQMGEEKFRAVQHKLIVRMPLLGDLTLNLALGHFARTLALLLSNGVSILESLSIVEQTLTHLDLRAAVSRLRENIQAGVRMGESLKALRIFPIKFVHLVSVGESAGRLDATLLKLALNYERESDRRIKWLTSLLEPFLILAVGLVVGIIVLAMLLPIFEMNALVR